MALKLNERYPGRFDNPSAGYPQGSFKNRTSPSAKDGSYLEKDWANDKEGFFQSLLASAVVQANGAVDRVGSSQYFNALMSIIGSVGVSWTNISGKPTTIAGYGITDAYTKAQIDASLSTKRNSSDGDFNVRINARQSVAVPQGAGLNFYDTGIATAFYRTGHDTSVWSFIVALTGGGELSAYTIARANGRISFAVRPLFNGNTPWDSANFDPALKINGNNCTEAGFASGDKGLPFMRHTDATVVNLVTAASAFGVGQTYQNMTASRALNTLYTNATGKMITVIFTGNVSAAGQLINAIVDGNTVMSPSITAATSNGSVSFPVPAGSNYRITQTGGTMVSWWEVRS